jgi:DnaJ-class molecular chaperone
MSDTRIFELPRCPDCDGLVRHKQNPNRCSTCGGAGRVNTDGSPLARSAIAAIMLWVFDDTGGWAETDENASTQVSPHTPGIQLSRQRCRKYPRNRQRCS